MHLLQHSQAPGVRPSCRQRTVAAPAQCPTPAARPAWPQLQRGSVVVQTTKSTELTDLTDYVERPNPERRYMKDINYREIVQNCTTWPKIQETEEVLRDRYGRQPGLAASLLIRCSEVVDMETASPAVKKQVAAWVDTRVGAFILEKGLFTYRPTIVPPLLAALAALQCRNTRLIKGLLDLFRVGVVQMQLAQVCAAACSAAQLQARLDRRLLMEVVDKLDRAVKFATPDDLANVAAALAPYGKMPDVVSQLWLSRYAAASQQALDAMSGEQLVDLLQVFVKQDFPLTRTWVASFQTALLPALPALSRPSSYSALLFCLAKGGLEIEARFLSTVLDRLAAPASPSAAPTRSASGVLLQPPTLLAVMSGADLAVLAAVLSIYGYTPSEAWVGEFVGAVQDKAEHMEAKQIVTIVSSCSELELPLGADLLDELLAVAEAGLVELPPQRLKQLAAALAAEGHQPDGPWTKQLHAALLAAAGRSKRAQDLAEVVAVLPHMRYAYAPDGKTTAEVLAAVRASPAAAEGLPAATRAAIVKALEQLGYKGAKALAQDLAPAPAQPQAPPAAPAAPAAPAKATAVAAAAEAPAAAAAASRAGSGAAAGASGRSSRVAAPAPSPAARPSSMRRRPVEDDEEEVVEEEEEDMPMASSTRGASRRSSGAGSRARRMDDEEEDDDEEEEEEEEVTRGRGPRRMGSRAAAAPAPSRSRAELPIPPPPSSRAAPPASAAGGMAGPGDDGEAFVASTRRSRRGSR